VGFEPTICGISPNGSTLIDCDMFDEYLTNAFDPRTQTEYRSNAKRYWHG
jgi:hypothetical protein